MQEMLKRKKLGLTFVIDELTEQYNDIDQSNNLFPKVYISKG